MVEMAHRMTNHPEAMLAQALMETRRGVKAHGHRLTEWTTNGLPPEALRRYAVCYHCGEPVAVEYIPEDTELPMDKPHAGRVRVRMFIGNALQKRCPMNEAPYDQNA